jgi:hypothetical protein
VPVARRVDEIAFPPESQFAKRLADATFHHAFETDLDDVRLTPLEIALRFLRATPAWVEALLAICNRAASVFGLRDVGALGAVDGRPVGAYAAGDRLSVFDIVSVSDEELMLSADDRHLDVRIAFLKLNKDERARYAICSRVRTHNALGRAYMVPVGPIHVVVVRQAMRDLVV